MNDKTLFFISSELLEDIKSEIRGKYDIEDDEEYCDIVESAINQHLHINLEEIIEKIDKQVRVVYDRRR